MDRSEQEWLTYLISQHDQQKQPLLNLDAYYEGTQLLSYMAPELLAEMDNRIRQVVINWPRLIVDSVEERLDVEGFRFPGKAKADPGLWEIWQANDLDEESQLGHLDALVMKRSFAIAGSNEDDEEIPLITVESPLEVHVEYDPRTRKVAAAIKRWCVEEGTTKTEFANLYLPDTRVTFQKEKGQWVEVDRDDHNLGVVPVVPLVNRPRTRNRGGVSELADVIPLSDAACKIATDMMVSAEYHAVPRRVAFGFSEEDFTDIDGNPVSAFSRVVGRVWATMKSRGGPDGADVVQFPEASLNNFHETINALAKLVASLSGLPPHFLGMTTDNPASADAIRSSEIRLIKRAERRQRTFGGSWEQVQRLALRIRDGEWNPDARRLETVWRSAATPTEAQSADAAVKRFQAGIVPLRQTREDLGYSETQIALMEEADQAADPMNRLLPPKPPPVPGPVPPEDAAAGPPPAA
ncbi:phage portal protein [Actinoallomurus purpureus]|uniref:phage portal protein n=1 Tax=Actinoallomurus purpureus TaxID=478114 RepID=UPI0020926A48|nr:phage portal protein [Actinoallomurus purpureus]MCO6011424.1 phage portal protein [Actinoallomurus purpureus]